MTRFRSAYDLARERFRAQDQRIRRVALAKPIPVREAVSRRPAEEVPFTPPPISIMAPKPETALDVHRFVMDQFTPKARRLAK
jgi:hypothetical protein